MGGIRQSGIPYFSGSASSSVMGTLNAQAIRSMLPIEIFRSPRSTELM